MSALAISLIVLLVMLASAWVGGALRDRLPKHHLSDESKDAIKIGVAGITTLAALVLGLLVTSAKQSFDTKYAEVQQAATKVVLLDSTLRQLGAGAEKPRDLLRRFVSAKVDYTWVGKLPAAVGADVASGVSAGTGAAQLEKLISDVATSNDAQRDLKTRALSLTYDLAQMRWLLVEQSGSTISTPLLVVLTFWLATISAALNLLAPRNGTVRAIGLLCVVSVAGTIFMLLEMDQPFEGLIQIPDTPLRNAITALGR